MAATKRTGSQECDACGRTFVVEYPKGTGGSIDWRCPYCGYDNKAGEEFYKNMARKAAAKRWHKE
jgi:DNA-directed RNA polymerase subunit RPC12/RpoP